jgi:GNAT superfamily N-acetyltransferase
MTKSVNLVWDNSLVSINGKGAFTCRLYSRRRPVGLAFLTPRRDDIFIEHIQTFPRYQNLGYGKALIKELIAHPLKSKRWIRLVIQPVLQGLDREQLTVFYEKLGFKPTRTKHFNRQVWERDTWKK